MGKFNTNRSFKAPGNLGFTLVELLVVVIILGIFASVATAILNPFSQFQKGADVVRQSDLKQISNALDTYYNDKTYYPQSLDELDTGTNPYMQQVPDDPDSNTDTPYTYVHDLSSSPQWFVLFSKMVNKPANKSFCSLEANGCVPSDYSNLGYNLCTYGGDVNCNDIQAMQIQP